MVAVALLQPLAHDQAQVLGERRVGIVDRLVLADEAAQLRRDLPGAMLQGRILQHLVGLDGVGRAAAAEQGERQASREVADAARSPLTRPAPRPGAAAPCALAGGRRRASAGR